MAWQDGIDSIRMETMPGGLHQEILSSTDASLTDEQWLVRLESLRAISELDDDWDGCGAERPSADLLESAFDLFDALQSCGNNPPLRIAAGPNGTIVFEWEGESGYQVWEIVRPYSAECMFVTPTGETEHFAHEWTRHAGLTHSESEAYRERDMGGTNSWIEKYLIPA